MNHKNHSCNKDTYNFVYVSVTFSLFTQYPLLLPSDEKSFPFQSQDIGLSAFMWWESCAL